MPRHQNLIFFILVFFGMLFSGTIWLKEQSEEIKHGWRGLGGSPPTGRTLRDDLHPSSTQTSIPGFGTSVKDEARSSFSILRVLYLWYASKQDRQQQQQQQQQITEPTIVKTEEKHKNLGLRSSPGFLYNQPSLLVGRTDVVTLTPWLAPIIWEGTFDPTLMDSLYKQQNITIATTVFALGKYTRFLKDFLESAEQHYFVGFRVHYYLFTDQPDAVPEVKLGDQHRLTVRKVPSLNRWQDISMGRMEILEKLIESELANEADYIFCLDVDTKFNSRWGVETLGQAVAVIHPWFYDYPRDQFTYERRPESQAFIPAGEGDYYYTAAAFGGFLNEVHELTKTCREQQGIDAAKSIEAIWHDESHLNKYFLYKKPSKLLSPEYLWRDINARTNQVRVIRFSHVSKNNAEVRPN
ncbi:globoside alpha-1,3-N-acetylgalactosaminyltransferase 1-like [Myxocyprinus asiaticus]|uniref:globoside alpha-1,3-N-acetylgalactosaminyltransferase 1-like n=1 Tax=Myxocyprinus asiaticus TaxID=70543 RepID=UPI0022233581|nr:globoside alpha-1,3-N-acetylgalactosaminyltransferase 1-like [Myxocyprinus asiaticus]